VPEDVDRISRMREKARRKAREDEERQQRLARGEVEDEPEVQAPHSGKEAAKAAEDEDDEASEAEEVSAEEMRRRRLARFG
jgi:ataxin-3